MDKKGSEHVDWMVSMGLFLVALITIFLLLKPGVQKEHNEAILLNMLEEKFTNDFYWTIKRVPIVVGVCESYIDRSKSPPVEVKPKINLDSGNGWSLTKTEFLKDESIINENKGEDPAQPVQDEITCTSNAPVGSCAKYQCNIQKGAKSIIYYFTYAQNNPVEFSIVDGSTSDCVQEHCDYRIGAIENFDGLNADGVNFKNFLSETKGKVSNPLSQYKKTNIKTLWVFPDNKDFFIKTSNGIDFNYETAQVEEGTNVYTKTFKTNIVNKYGEITPVTIYLGVW